MARFWGSSRKELHPDDVRMTLGEHLEELRSRLIRALLGLLVGGILCYVFIGQVMGFLTSPMYAVLRRHGIKPTMVALNPAENFITFLKVAAIVGFIVSAPYSLAQVWGFIAAGLYPKERRWVRRFAPASIALFFTGAGFLLLVVNPLLLNFLVSYAQELPNYDYAPHWLLGEPDPLPGAQTPAVWPTTQPIPVFKQDPQLPPEGAPWISLRDRAMRIRVGDTSYTVSRLEPVQQVNRLEPMMRISEYVIFVLELSAAFGIGFQVPIVVAFMATFGIASAAQMAGFRRYVWFGMSIVAAVITPPDVSSMLLLLIPMAGLYEVGLLVSRLIERERAQTAEKEEVESEN